jgi:quinol monooxygenase YgiN
MAEKTSGFVTVLFECTAKPGKEEELRSVIAGLVTPTRSEPGCISYEFHTVENKPGTFIAYEQWISQEALDAHVKTAPLQAFIQRSSELLQAPFESGLRLLHPLRPQPK